MRYTLTTKWFVLFVLIGAGRSALGHGFELSFDGNTIVGTSDDYPGSGNPQQFARALNALYIQTSGGVAASAGGLSNGDTYGLELLTPLMYSNGGAATPAAGSVSLGVTSHPGTDYNVAPIDTAAITGTSSVDFLGVSGTSSHSTRWTLTGSPPPGVYGFAYRAHGVNGSTDEDYDPSRRLVVLFNTPDFTDATQVANARAAVYAAVPEPSAVGLAIFAGIVLVAANLGRRQLAIWLIMIAGGLAFAGATTAYGHGFTLTLQGNKIGAASQVGTARSQLFADELDVGGPEVLFTDHGGVETASGFDAQDTFSLQFFGPLWFSDGGFAQRAGGEMMLTAESYTGTGALEDTEELTGSSSNPGATLWVSGSDSHSIGWILSGPFEDGVYGFSYQVLGLNNGNEAVPFDTSDRLIVAFATPGFAGGVNGSLASAQLAIYNMVRADFDGDLELDADDIDLLYDHFGANSAYDLTGDLQANQADVDYWISQVRQTSYGDADLDGGVGGLDFTAWRLRAGNGWAHGDFDGDGGVGGLDFTLWRTRPTAIAGTGGGGMGAAAPEPAAGWLAVLGAAIVCRFRRGRGDCRHGRRGPCCAGRWLRL